MGEGVLYRLIVIKGFVYIFMNGNGMSFLFSVYSMLGIRLIFLFRLIL